MSQIIPIYIPQYISSVDYQPTRVLPRLLYYNGQVNCEPFFVKNGGAAVQINNFPYFDNYNVVTGSFPTTGSKSLLFFNEEAVYGQTPTASLYSAYWNDYVELLYNPRTRILNASAIIPLADYFDMELNDIVEFRGNYYHLRAINDYNLKNGECSIQLLGPILPQALPFAADAVPVVPVNPCCTPTLNSVTANGGNIDLAFTLGTGECLGCVATTIQSSTDGVTWGNNNTAGCTSPRTLTAPAEPTYYRIITNCEGSVSSTPSNSILFTPSTTTTSTTTSTTTTSTTTTTAGSATLYWSFSEVNGGNAIYDLYINSVSVETRNSTANGTYTVYVGDIIEVGCNADQCTGGGSTYTNIVVTGELTDAACQNNGSIPSYLSPGYTVVSGDIGTNLFMDLQVSCDGGCI